MCKPGGLEGLLIPRLFRHSLDVKRALRSSLARPRSTKIQWHALMHEEGVEFQSQGVFHVVQTRRTCTIFLLDFFHTVSLRAHSWLGFLRSRVALGKI